ncbi:MAG TPA: DUF3617 family protein [Burkholderiales bacterium]|nr:DUF3617 family protein [Burkholderiales bacterium]
MKRLFLAVLCCVATQPGIATEIEPGEWEFTSVSTSRLLPGPQKASFKRCIRKEEAENPDKWMAEPSQQGDCKVIPGKKSADTYTWTMQCPHGNIRGTGSARLSRVSMEGETNMTGELQGQKFEIRTRVTGKRLGPCK